MKELQAIKPEELVEHVQGLVANPTSISRFILDDPNFPIIVEINLATRNKSLVLSYKRQISDWRWWLWWRNSRERAADRAKKIYDLIQSKDAPIQSVIYRELTPKEYELDKAGGSYGIPASYLTSQTPQTVTGVAVAVLLIGLAIALYAVPPVGLAITSLSVLALAVSAAIAVGVMVYKAIGKIREKIVSKRAEITGKINEEKGIVIQPKFFKVKLQGSGNSAAIEMEPADSTSKLAGEFDKAYKVFKLGNNKKQAGQLLKKLFEKNGNIAAIIKAHLRLYQLSYYKLYKMAIICGALKPDSKVAVVGINNNNNDNSNEAKDVPYPARVSTFEEEIADSSPVDAAVVQNMKALRDIAIDLLITDKKGDVSAILQALKIPRFNSNKRKQDVERLEHLLDRWLQNKSYPEQLELLNNIANKLTSVSSTAESSFFKRPYEEKHKHFLECLENRSQKVVSAAKAAGEDIAKQSRFESVQLSK